MKIRVLLHQTAREKKTFNIRLAVDVTVAKCDVPSENDKDLCDDAFLRERVCHTMPSTRSNKK